MAGTSPRRVARWILAVVLALVATRVVTLAVASGLPAERETALARWHPDFRERCLLPGGASDASRWTRSLAALTALLEHDEALAGTLLAVARRADVVVCLDDRYDGTYGYYDATLNVIVLSDRLSTGERSVILVHELRHLDAAQRGYRPSLAYDMEAAADVTRAGEADAQAVATLFAWRMRLLGEPGPWRAIERLEDFKDGAMLVYQDIAPAFAAAIASGGGELDALRAAFQRWFLSPWRTHTYYRDACMGYLDRCDETHALPSYDDLPNDWFDGMCVLPDGRDYRCKPPTTP